MTVVPSMSYGSYLKPIGSGALLVGEKYFIDKKSMQMRMLWIGLAQAVSSYAAQKIRIDMVDAWVVNTFGAAGSASTIADKAKLALGITDPIYCAILYSVISGFSDIDGARWWIRALESLGAELIADSLYIWSIPAGQPPSPSPAPYVPRESATLNSGASAQTVNYSGERKC